MFRNFVPQFIKNVWNDWSWIGAGIIVFINSLSLYYFSAFEIEFDVEWRHKLISLGTVFQTTLEFSKNYLKTSNMTLIIFDGLFRPCSLVYVPKIAFRWIQSPLRISYLNRKGLNHCRNCMAMVVCRKFQCCSSSPNFLRGTDFCTNCFQLQSIWFNILLFISFKFAHFNQHQCHLCHFYHYYLKSGNNLIVERTL